MNVMFHVVIPHYGSTQWLSACLDTHQKRSKFPETIVYSVVTMNEAAQVAEVGAAVANRARVFSHPTPGMYGGRPLSVIFPFGCRLRPESPYTVLVDTDALMLAQDWDQRLLDLFADPELVVAGINPRGNYFKDAVEWNWMAFSTGFWSSCVGHFDLPGYHDYGHIMTSAVHRHGKKQHLWGFNKFWMPARQSASICGDAVHPAWVMHAFYSTRRLHDALNVGEVQKMLTPEEQAQCIDYCMP